MDWEVLVSILSLVQKSLNFIERSPNNKNTSIRIMRFLMFLKFSITQPFLLLGLICLGYGLGSVGFHSFSRPKIFELYRKITKQHKHKHTNHAIPNVSQILNNTTFLIAWFDLPRLWFGKCWFPFFFSSKNL